MRGDLGDHGDDWLSGRFIVKGAASSQRMTASGTSPVEPEALPYNWVSRADGPRMVGNPYLGISSCLPVIQAQFSKARRRTTSQVNRQTHLWRNSSQLRQESTRHHLIGALLRNLAARPGLHSETHP